MDRRNDKDKGDRKPQTLAGVITQNLHLFGEYLTKDDLSEAVSKQKQFLKFICFAWKNRFAISKAASERAKKTDKLQMEEWRQFYAEVFGDTNSNSINPSLPSPEYGFGWIVVIRKGLTLNKVAQVLEETLSKYNGLKYFCRYGEDLESAVLKHDRVADNTYAIRVRDRADADEELLGKGVNWLRENNTKGMTLLERLILGLFYLWKLDPLADIKEGILDRHHDTFCGGSRDIVGGVPVVDWLDTQGLVRICQQVFPDEPREDQAARAVLTV